MLKYRICFFSPYECTLKTTYCMLQSQSIGYTIREAESGRTPMRREKGCMAIKWRSGGQKEMDERNSCLWQRLADRGRRTGQASVGGRGGGLHLMWESKSETTSTEATVHQQCCLGGLQFTIQMTNADEARVSIGGHSKEYSSKGVLNTAHP